MPQAAIYARDPLLSPGNILSADDQEKACRDYCQARGLTVTATFIDTAGARDEFGRMVSEAARDHSPLDCIVVWKLNRFSMSLEETIKLRDKLRRIGTRLVSTIYRMRVSGTDIEGEAKWYQKCDWIGTRGESVAKYRVEHLICTRTAPGTSSSG